MNDRRYVVYCHRNKANGFEYIGMTGRSVKARWSGKISSYANCKYFEEALKQYGWDAFEHLVLFSGLTKDEASKKETELIRKNIARGISYNVRDDDNWFGDLRKRPVDVYDLDGNLLDTCESIHSVCTKYGSGETHTYYCVLGIKKTLKHKYVLAFHGDDATERIKEANIDRRRGFPAHNRRKVVMYSIEGQQLMVFDSATLASEYVNTTVGCIVSCCTGRKKTCRGYKWSYAS